MQVRTMLCIILYHIISCSLFSNRQVPPSILSIFTPLFSFSLSLDLPWISFVYVCAFFAHTCFLILIKLNLPIVFTNLPREAGQFYLFAVFVVGWFHISFGGYQLASFFSSSLLWAQHTINCFFELAFIILHQLMQLDSRLNMTWMAKFTSCLRLAVALSSIVLSRHST